MNAMDRDLAGVLASDALKGEVEAVPDPDDGYRGAG
jgi:hypothetical protein